MKLRICDAQLSGSLSFDVCLGVMNGFCMDISLGFVANPEYDFCERRIFVKSDTDYFFETFFKVGLARFESISRFWIHLDDTVECKNEHAICVVSASDNIPTAVILFEKVGG